MKLHISSWLLASTSFTFRGSVDAAGGGGGLRSSPNRRLKDKTCVILQKVTEHQDKPHSNNIDCWDPEASTYIPVEAEAEKKILKDIKEGKIRSGEAKMNADGSYYSDEPIRHRVLHVPDVDSITYEDYVPEHGRRLATVVGQKNMLAIRVVAPDATTSSSEEVISDSWFGTSGDLVNLKSQYAACSYDQLICNGYEGTTSTGATVTTPGVYTVSISQTVNGVADGTVRNAVTNAATAALGNLPAQFDHVMECLPAGTSGSWIAYAYINHYLSVYNNQWCNYVSGQMHEIGHNLNLAHSGEGGQTYADQSGMMGYSYSQDDGPRMCFNAAKNWQLGWYSEGHHQIGVGGHWTGNMVGIVNYEDRGSAMIVLRLHDPSANTDYYVSFNRKTGFNSGTVEGGNQVLVHSRPTGTGYAASNLVTKLNAGGTITVLGLPITVSAINLSAIPAYATITVGTPTEPTPPPTPAPTKLPTPPPTSAPVPPTPPPTPAPTIMVEKFVCNKWEPADVCATGARSEGSKCANAGGSPNGTVDCGNGGKKCWMANCPETGGNPPSPTPPTAPTTPPPTPPSGGCSSYTGGGDCKAAGCTWSQGACYP